MSFDRALRLIEAELVRFRAMDVVLTHNDNRRSTPRDAAASLFFKLGVRDISICCDIVVFADGDETMPVRQWAYDDSAYF